MGFASVRNLALFSGDYPHVLPKKRYDTTFGP